MKKSKGLYVFLSILGAALFASGILVQLFFDNSKYLGFSTGLGSAFVAVGIANIVLLKIKEPEYFKQQRINDNDERNIKIREKSAYSTFFITMFGLVAVELIFIFLDYMIPTFIVMGMLFIHICSLFFFTVRYSKKI